MTPAPLTPGEKKRYRLTGSWEGSKTSLEDLEKRKSLVPGKDFAEYRFVYLVYLCTFIYLCFYISWLNLYLSYA